MMVSTSALNATPVPPGTVKVSTATPAAVFNTIVPVPACTFSSKRNAIDAVVATPVVPSAGLMAESVGAVVSLGAGAGAGEGEGEVELQGAEGA